MAFSWSVFLGLQYLSLQCYAYPRFAVRDAHPHITAAPDSGAMTENQLLRRQNSCTWACAVCALYAPCENCVSLSTPAGIECCTSKLADQSACPTANVPPESTIYIYTLNTLTLYGNPTSLVIGSQTVTPGGNPAIVQGHTFSVPTTATGGGLVEDGTTTTLGTPISTVIGTGNGPFSTSGPTSTLCLVQEISNGQVQNVPCSATNSGTQAIDTNPTTNTGGASGTVQAGTTTGTVQIGTDTNLNTNTEIATGTVTGVDVNTATGSGTASVINTDTNSVTGTGTGSGTGIGATSTNTATGNTNSGTDTGNDTGIGAGTKTATGTGLATGINTNTNTATNSNTGTDINANTNTGTGTQTGTVTQTGTGAQIGTSAGADISATAGTGTMTGTNTNTITNVPAPSTYTIDGIPFTGNPTSLVAGTFTLTPGGPGLTSSGHTIAILTGATGGQIQVDGSPTALPTPNTATNTGTGPTGTNTGSIFGSISGSITGTGEEYEFVLS